MPGVGVHHVRPLSTDDLLQQLSGAEHASGVPPVHGDLVVADARGHDLRDIDTAVGGHHDVVSLRLQLLGQLYDMGLRSADIQAHSGHQDLHVCRPFLKNLCHCADELRVFCAEGPGGVDPQLIHPIQGIASRLAHQAGALYGDQHVHAILHRGGRHGAVVKLGQLGAGHELDVGDGAQVPPLLRSGSKSWSPSRTASAT